MGDETMTLMRAFEFDEIDLAANRVGEFSDSQRRKLRRVALGYLAGTLIALVCALLLLEGLFFFMIEGGDVETLPKYALLFLLGFVPMAFLAYLAYTRMDMVTGRVSVIEGPGRCWQSEVNGKTYLEIDDSRFELETRYPEAARQSIEDGVHYRVYYVKGGANLLLTIEWVADMVR